MADKSIGELVAATGVTPTDLFLLEQSGTAKKLTGKILGSWLVSVADGHGGIKSIAKLSTSGLVDTYRITLADTTTFDFTVTNGTNISSIEKTSTSGLVDTYTIKYNDGNSSTFTVTNGRKGDKGDNAYVWVKYASQEPTEASHSMGDIPDDWVGIYSGNSATAPTDYTRYKWYKIKGEQGETGETGKSGLSIFYTSEDKGPEAEGAGTNFNPDLIKVIPGSDVRVGDMLLTPSGKIFKVMRLPYDAVTFVYAVYLTTIKGKDGLNGQNGLSIFPVNSDSTDVESTFLATDIKTFGRAPQIGDLLLTPNGRVFQINDSGVESYSAGFFSSIRGPSGGSAYEQEERELMMALFKNATYSKPMTDTLNALSRLWGFMITVSFYDSMELGEFVGTLECPKGMTWGEFVDSEYNTKGFHFTGSILYSENEYLVYGVLRSSSVATTYNRITSDVEVGKYSEYTYDLP